MIKHLAIFCKVFFAYRLLDVQLGWNVYFVGNVFAVFLALTHALRQ